MTAQHLQPLWSVDARLLKRDEYDRLVAAGVFTDERLELLDGVIVRMSPQNTPHASTVQRLNRLCMKQLDLTGKATVRVQAPFIASDLSEPEPDISVVPVGDYVERHPSQASLIIEVSDESLSKDRGPKARLYAVAGVPEYWVVNLRDRIIEVHTDVVSGGYSRVTPYRANEQITLVVFPDVVIKGEEVLG